MKLQLQLVTVLETSNASAISLLWLSRAHLLSSARLSRSSRSLSFTRWSPYRSPPIYTLLSIAFCYLPFFLQYLYEVQLLNHSGNIQFVSRQIHSGASVPRTVPLIVPLSLSHGVVYKHSVSMSLTSLITRVRLAYRPVRSGSQPACLKFRLWTVSSEPSAEYNYSSIALV